MALSQLTYPSGQWEVLVGDDDSADQTAQIVKDFIADQPHFRLVHIGSAIGLARGKANVLAQLAQVATGDYLLITDADVQVPPTWIQTMLAACEPGTGIVTGTTAVSGTRLFHHLQAIDWLHGQALIASAAQQGKPLTAMGNNMLITRKAYQATGGYEHLPFSITEDFALFHAVVQRGFGFKHVFSPEVLAWTQPVYSLMELLQQRKRWMTGAIQLPIRYRLFFLLQALFAPAMLILLSFYPLIAGLIWVTKVAWESLLIVRALRKLHCGYLIRYIFLFEPYRAFVALTTLVFYAVPVKIRWKNRTYARHPVRST